MAARTPVGTGTRKLLVAGVATLALCALALPPTLRALGSFDATRTAATGGAAPRFVVSGTVGGLYPGRTAAMKLVVKNPNKYPIKVQWLRATVAAAPRPDCAAGWLRPAGRLAIAKRIRGLGRTTLSYTVQLLPGAPNACIGVRWPLKFDGRAVKVR